MGARELLESVLLSAPDFIARITLDGRFLFVNRVWPSTTLERTIGRSIFDYMPPEERDRVRAIHEQVARTGEPATYDCPGFRADGTRVEYRARVGPIREGDGIVGLTLVTSDITQQKATERALRESEEKLRLAVEATGMGQWSIEREPRQGHWDEAACRILGVTTDAATHPFVEGIAFVHPADRAGVAARIERALEGGEFEDAEYRVIRADGATRWVLCKGTVVRDRRGEVVRLMGGIFDVTERRQLEEQLRQAQKMEAFGQLSAGIAHNFNNMLAVMLPTLETAMARAQPPLTEMLEGARDAAQRAAAIVRELMIVAGKPRASERRPRALEAMVERTVAMCRTTFDPQIDIEVVAPDDLPRVAADDGQIEQALLNVLINARDALDGVVDRPRRIRVSVDVAAREALPAYLGAREPSYVRVRVEDTGAGMDEETRRRAFEPFFTTKDVGRGTGLGLASTYGIVRDHGGLVDCQSAPGRGTTVTLALPALDERPCLAAAPRSR